MHLRNPWGRRDYRAIGEWLGPWSDGSSNWTSEWLDKLDHRFGDDGVFWMAYEDLLSTFQMVFRTRIFDDTWSIAEKWTRMNADWMGEYSRGRFVAEVKSGGLYVFVLSQVCSPFQGSWSAGVLTKLAQIDSRYFKGLEGQYEFNIRFLVVAEGDSTENYLCRADPFSEEVVNRSVSCEIELEPGRYEVISKIIAHKVSERRSVEKLLPSLAKAKPRKLRQIGLNFDHAHAKGQLPDEAIVNDEQKAEADKTAVGDVPKRSDKRAKGDKQTESSKSTQDTFPKPGDGEGGMLPRLQRRHTAPDVTSVAAQVECSNRASDEEDGGTFEGNESRHGEDNDPVTETDDSDQSDDGDDGDEDIPHRPGREKRNDDRREDSRGGASEKHKRSHMPESWNAVCVIGLRVFSHDPEVTISLA